MRGDKNCQLLQRTNKTFRILPLTNSQVNIENANIWLRLAVII